MGQFIDLTGSRFERLLVVRRSARLSRWECVCDCGKTTNPTSYTLRKGIVKSCGCYNRDAVAVRNVVHGKRCTPEYEVWSSIVQRTTNQNNRRFSDYGGRGIDIDPRWLSFENFIADMGERPSSIHSVERVNNDLGYWKSNCIWGLAEDQANNSRRNCLLTLNGKTQSVTQWCRELNLNYRTVNGRLVAYGWSPERALTTPTKGQFKGSK